MTLVSQGKEIYLYGGSGVIRNDELYLARVEKQNYKWQKLKTEE